MPLKRSGPKGSGEFTPISWGEAFDTIERNLNAAKAAHGAESVVFFAGYAKWFRPYLKRLAHSFFSPNYATESSTCYQAMAMAQRLVFGLPGGPDLPNTACLLVWSSNPFHTNPGVAKVILNRLKSGMKLIVVDPRQTPTTARADLHLYLRPGTDGALALAMANVIISENLYDADFVENWTYGFDEYADYVQGFPPEEGERLTGVPQETIIAAARMFACAESACIMPSASPVVHHTNGVQNYRAVFMLAGLTGNYDVTGGNVVRPPSFVYQSGKFISREREYEQSVPFDTMAPRIGAEQFPVWMDVADGQAQAMMIPDQIHLGKPYPIKAILAFAMNFRMWPDSQGMKKSLEALGFFVNMDIFMTETCKYADILLPACTSMERSEFRCYNSGYVLYTQPAIPPLYESRSDADVIFEL